MRFLLDQGLPRSAAAALSAQGHDTVHVGTLGMGESSDEEIIARARAESRVAVTLDADFHSIIALSGEDRPSAIRIRIEGLNSEAVVKLITSLAIAMHEDLEAGSLVTVTTTRVRVRRLPIAG